MCIIMLCIGVFVLHSGILFYASHLFDVMGTCMILWVHVHDCIIYIYLPPSIYLCISDCMEWSYYIARALMFFCFCDDGFGHLDLSALYVVFPLPTALPFRTWILWPSTLNSPSLNLVSSWPCTPNRGLVGTWFFPARYLECGLVGTWFFPARYHKGSLFEPGFLWPGTWPVRVFVAICHYFVIQIAPSADTFWVFFCSYPGSISQLQF